MTNKRSVGDRFGRWTLLGEPRSVRTSSGNKTLVRARCECGNEKDVRLGNLVRGTSTRCFECRDVNAARPRSPAGHEARNRIFLNYKSAARQRGRTWEISSRLFCELTTRPCDYCGAPPGNTTRDRRGDGAFVYSGLDRVDPSGHYIPENVVPACIVCNRAKADMSREQFWSWILSIEARAPHGGERPD